MSDECVDECEQLLVDSVCELQQWVRHRLLRIFARRRGVRRDAAARRHLLELGDLGVLDLLDACVKVTLGCGTNLHADRERCALRELVDGGDDAIRQHRQWRVLQQRCEQCVQRCSSGR